jgi:hypothetical protein
MASKIQRKVIEVGNKKYQSKAITLPPDWVRFNKPDKVDIFYDSLLVISLPEQSIELEKKLKDFLQIISVKKERDYKKSGKK